MKLLATHSAGCDFCRRVLSTSPLIAPDECIPRIGRPSHARRWRSPRLPRARPSTAEEQNNISVYRKNIDSVVNITSRAMTFDFFYGLVPQEGQGSGFIIDKEGHVLTNYHVIADARQVEVTLHNRKKYRATVVGTDRSHDLAVIQIKGPGLNPMVLGRFAQFASWAESVCHRKSIRPVRDDDPGHHQFDPSGAGAGRNADR